MNKSLSSDIVPNQQEMLTTPRHATPTQKKKKKSTPVLRLFHEATHSPVDPEYTGQNMSMNISSTKIPG
jgi:hypothetical protein